MAFRMAEAMQSDHHDLQIVRFQQSEALLRNVMENAAVGMVLIGIEGRVIYANRAFADMLGYEPSGCVGFDLEAHRASRLRRKAHANNRRTCLPGESKTIAPSENICARTANRSGS